MIADAMMYFSEDAERNLLEIDERAHLFDFLTQPRYRVGDIPFTYRQIYLLSQDGLLDAQQDDGKWRKFSFTEIIFLLAVKELKTMGFTNERLVPLYKTFFKGRKNEAVKRSGGMVESRGYAAKAVAYVFLQIPVTMRCTADGDVDFYDPIQLPMFGIHGTSFVLISITDLVNQLLTTLGRKHTFDNTAHEAFIKAFLSREAKGDKVLVKEYQADMKANLGRAKELGELIAKNKSERVNATEAIATFEEFHEMFTNLANLIQKIDGMADLDFIVKKIFMNVTVTDQKVTNITQNSRSGSCVWTPNRRW